MATAKMQTHGFEMVVHKPVGDATVAASMSDAKASCLWESSDMYGGYEEVNEQIFNANIFFS